jgi:transcription initiation factor TFIID subunit 6
VRELLPEVELRVRELVQDALKFKRHSKKPLLTTKHVNQALQARHLEVPTRRWPASSPVD